MKKFILLYAAQLSTALFLSLAGCSSLNCIPDRSCEYQTSPCLAPLTLPPGLGSTQVGDDMTIPHLRRACGKTSLLPPDSLALQVAQGKISKKDLKQRENGLTQVTWTKNKWGCPALMTCEALPSTFNHLERALKTLPKWY